MLLLDQLRNEMRARLAASRSRLVVNGGFAEYDDDEEVDDDEEFDGESLGFDDDDDDEPPPEPTYNWAEWTEEDRRNRGVPQRFECGCNQSDPTLNFADDGEEDEEMIAPTINWNALVEERRRGNR